MFDNEEYLLQMVANGGEANALAYDALDEFAEGNTDKAFELLEQAGDLLGIAHDNQSKVLQMNMKNPDESPISVLTIHAMDICALAASNVQYTKRLIAAIPKRKRHE